jgi:hypothetical protein
MKSKRPIELVVRRRWLPWSRWYIRFVDTDNGKVLAHSENYSSLDAAMDTAEMIARSLFVVVQEGKQE